MQSQRAFSNTAQYTRNGVLDRESTNELFWAAHGAFNGSHPLLHRIHLDKSRIVLHNPTRGRDHEKTSGRLTFQAMRCRNLARQSQER
jgi:hypothetical protein